MNDRLIRQRGFFFGMVLILAVIYVPFLNLPFNTVPLTLQQWEVILPLVLIPAIVAEVSKYFVRRNERKHQLVEV